MSASAPMTRTAERRKSPRHNMRGSVEIIIEDGLSYLGSIRDISLDGCFIESKDKKELDETLRLKLSVGANFEITGMVLRIEKDGFAVKFLNAETAT